MGSQEEAAGFAACCRRYCRFQNSAIQKVAPQDASAPSGHRVASASHSDHRLPLPGSTRYSTITPPGRRSGLSPDPEAPASSTARKVIGSESCATRRPASLVCSHKEPSCHHEGCSSGSHHHSSRFTGRLIGGGRTLGGIAKVSAIKKGRPH